MGCDGKNVSAEKWQRFGQKRSSKQKNDEIAEERRTRL
jgi:hypothetical protein